MQSLAVQRPALQYSAVLVKDCAHSEVVGHVGVGLLTAGVETGKRKISNRLLRQISINRFQSQPVLPGIALLAGDDVGGAGGEGVQAQVGLVVEAHRVDVVTVIGPGTNLELAAKVLGVLGAKSLTIFESMNVKLRLLTLMLTGGMWRTNPDE